MSVYTLSILAEVLDAVERIGDLPLILTYREGLIRDAALAVAEVGLLDRSQGRDFDRHDRLYTAAEVGDYQASEAELVSEPLRLQVKSLQAQLDEAQSTIRHLTREIL